MNRDSRVVEIELSKIVPNRFQPRKIFNEDVSELAESIRQHGLLQPITVRPLGDKYEIVMGERRFRACEKLGLKKIAAMVIEINDRESMEVALIENLQRQNLTPIEEALSYKRILDAGYTTQEQLAMKIGKTQSTIANKLRLLSLNKDVQNALMKGEISERHARSLLRVENKEQQKTLLNKIINERLTVKKTDEEIRKMERNKLETTPNSPIEIIDFDDNPYKAYELPKKEVVREEPKLKNIPITQIIDDSNEETPTSFLEVNHSYANKDIGRTISEREISSEKTQAFNDDLMNFYNTKSTNNFEEMMSETSSQESELTKITTIVNAATEEIKKLGYQIEIENFDFENMFEVIFKITKK